MDPELPCLSARCNVSSFEIGYAYSTLSRGNVYSTLSRDRQVAREINLQRLLDEEKRKIIEMFAEAAEDDETKS